MSEEFNANNIEEVLRSGAKKAEDYLKNPEGLEALLQKLEATMKDIPYVGESASRLPLMISMIRSYILQEYTEVSPRVIGSLVGLVLYLLKKKDLIPDDIPIIGRLDDIAAIALVLWFTEPDLRAYSQWRANKGAVKAAEPAEECCADKEECCPETEETCECAAEETTEEE
ncbi:MAG: DUF1232 domain-containing protein [Erysipelotrichaceae bacterium]|nr:DUF1232 domain-containing protein [Erysipelotrichaceae bacterium]